MPDWLFYDDACQFCRCAAAHIRKFAPRMRIEVAPLQSEQARHLLNLREPELTADVRMVLEDGRRVSGAEVYRILLSRIPSTRLLARWSSIPGLSLIFQAAYWVVRRYRHRLTWLICPRRRT